jgi:hypothetical protein
VSLPYSKITSVAVISDASLVGRFFSSSSIALTVGSVVYDIEFRGQDKAHHVHNVVLWHMTR